MGLFSSWAYSLHGLIPFMRLSAGETVNDVAMHQHNLLSFLKYIKVNAVEIKQINSDFFSGGFFFI